VTLRAVYRDDLMSEQTECTLYSIHCWRLDEQ